MRRNDSGRSQRRGKFIKWFENVILKDRRWALEFTRGGFEFWPWHIVSQPRASYFPNFSFLIDKMGMMSFLIGLNDTGKRLSIPWWLSEVYLCHRLLSFLTSKFVCSAIYLLLTFLSNSDLTCPTPDFKCLSELFYLWSFASLLKAIPQEWENFWYPWNLKCHIDIFLFFLSSGKAL